VLRSDALSDAPDARFEGRQTQTDPFVDLQSADRLQLTKSEFH
jgi:hypothetical protein